MLREKASACVLGELGSRLLVLRQCIKTTEGFSRIKIKPPKRQSQITEAKFRICTYSSFYEIACAMESL